MHKKGKDKTWERYVYEWIPLALYKSIQVKDRYLQVEVAGLGVLVVLG